MELLKQVHTRKVIIMRRSQVNPFDFSSDAYYSQLLDEAIEMGNEEKPSTIRIEGVYGTLGGSSTHTVTDAKVYNVSGAASALLN
jgi:hypothetical protein